MNKAIITGATGLVGMAVAKHLSELGIDVLCLGRQILELDDINRYFGVGSKYLSIAMEDINSLVDRVDSIAWSPGTECVFFNFAWQGNKNLTDGSFDDQLCNAIHAAEAVRVAKKLSCIKFVNGGSLEETFLEQSLERIREHSYQSTQSNYALAKLASRDICKMVAYLEKIDYVHTRMSVPLSPDLSQGTYVAATLKQIIEGKPYEEPTNRQLFNIIFTNDVSKAYHLIGCGGKNKADYFVGTSTFITLGQYFEMIRRLVNNDFLDEADIAVEASAVSFDTDALHRDTGFIATTRLQDIVENFGR